MKKIRIWAIKYRGVRKAKYVDADDIICAIKAGKKWAQKNGIKGEIKKISFITEVEKEKDV